MDDLLTAQGWIVVCELDDILPDTGVCALVDDQQVAIFRVGERALYALDNIDPHAQAAVLARGLVGNLGERLVVASPLHKQHFDLRTGECLEAPEHSVRTWQVKLDGDRVLLGRRLP